MKKKQDELLNSNYDGIQEYDNDLPRWWKALFIITIIFGLVYVAYRNLGYSPDTEAALQHELKEIQAKQASTTSTVTSAETLLAFTKDPNHLAAGKAVFQTKCVACHGPEGQGLVGPNLTDNFWIHGGKISEIQHTIINGVLDKGMLSWKGLLSDQEIADVAAYIFSLKGTNPANPKPAQGEKEDDE